ncbi:glycoside hydrolase family 76 protein [Mucilaginibacter agri]|uniref:Glycoside hydrolase n=1 Tax=Mucilaginibacter agri TaxID=2695265 RepID=A0A966DUZ9_9SPHI|nr:glycoside hydrolase family 76 protein [Mucilaginibacter agri]NCD72325.1 glycoside hydrolase [Mucilaginibacter agri]
MKKRLLSIILVLLTFSDLKAQLPDYQARIELIKKAIDVKIRDDKTGLYFETTDSIKRENLHSWLWPLCAYMQAANEMEELAPKAQFMLPIEQAIDQYYSDKPPVPAYQDYVTKERLSSRFYDDNQWIAIAYLDAYRRNHKKKYLDVSEMICKFMLSGRDTVTGGGMYWKEGDLSTKNTCSNGPGVLVLLQLYQLTNDSHYLTSAFDIYHWTNKRLQAPDGLYYDNINTKTLKIAEAKYTYNTGTMLQANVILYKMTREKKYLAEAQRIAAAGRKYFFKDGRLPNGEYWFNAVMLRGYEELYKVDKNKAWIDFYQQDADAIWATERDENNMLGSKPAMRLIDQAAMIEIYARLQQLKNITN